MMYKFINEHQIEKYTKPYVYVDGLQISHPSAEVLLMAGVKALVVEEVPVFDPETQYAEPYYIDGETEITQKWIVKDIPEGVIEDESITNA
jgi:hypothetical protein